MRHDLTPQSYTKVDVAAVWPAGVQVAPLPVPDLEAKADFLPTAAAPDVPAGVGSMIVGSYVALIGAFTLATVASAYSVFMIAVVGVFLAAFFTVPWLFLKLEPQQGRRPTVGAFLRQGMDTLTGHSGGGAALVQMLIVPVMLTFGALAMAAIAAFYL